MGIRWSALALILIARTVGAITAEPLAPPTRTPETLAQSLVGSGISISNVTFVGNDSAAGTFVDGADSVGFASGIVLSSGLVADIAGPNDADDTSTDFFLDGDADLDSAIPGFLTRDAAVLEFDFVPAGPEVTFRYVFASEEYNEFVNSEFNDVFGFFVNGVNLARLPDATTVVSINTVNAGNPEDGSPAVNPGFFVPNDCSDGPCTVPFEADGATVVLTLKAAVNPGVTNHLKLAIADAGDGDYDSWVFIEAQSLTLSEDCTNGVDDDGDGLVDGADPDCQVCGDGDLDPGEACDDHNLVDGDGCSSTCMIEPPTTTSSTTSTTTTSSSPSTEPTTSSTSTSTTAPTEPSSTTTTVLPPTTSSSTTTLVTTSTTTTSVTTTSASPSSSSTTSTTSTSVPANRAPDCSGARAALGPVGPPNHRMVDVPITGVVDPDHDPVSITVTGITQDEPVDGEGDGSTCPDASGIGGDTASIRAERAASGDGRVYHVAFRASDGRNGTCTGTVTVCVPHDANGTCGDGGALVDATGPANCTAVDAPSVSPLGGGATFPVTVSVPADVLGRGKVNVKAQLFLEPPTVEDGDGAAALAASGGAAAAAQTGAVKLSKPLTRVVKPGAHATFTLRLNKHGRQLLLDAAPLLVRASVTVKRNGLEPTVFEVTTRWRK